MQNYLLYIKNLSVGDVVDILIVSIAIYQVYFWVSKTAALTVLQGFVVIICLTFLSRIFELETLNFVLEKVLSLLLFSLIVLFPGEIKKAFSRIGNTDIMPQKINLEKKNIEIFLQSIMDFRKNKTGALFIFRRRDSLATVIKSGVEMCAPINKQLFISIFQRKSPLHDGAVVIFGNVIEAVACFIPTISFDYDSFQKIGTRHRAAISLSEHTDACLIVVSEETGSFSIAEDGKIILNVSLKKLQNYLEKL